MVRIFASSQNQVLNSSPEKWVSCDNIQPSNYIMIVKVQNVKQSEVVNFPPLSPA